MHRAPLMLLVALALLALAASATWAQFGTDEFEGTGPSATIRTNDPPPMTSTGPDVAPAALSPEDPDRTGYPYINNWKGGLNRDVRVFLDANERQALTQARVDETSALRGVVARHVDSIRDVLTPDQRRTFNAIVSTWDLEKMAAMTDQDWLVYRAYLVQRLDLNGAQAERITAINRELIADMTPIRAQYAGRFDAVIASAEQRVALRRSGTATATSP